MLSCLAQGVGSWSDGNVSPFENKNTLIHRSWNNGSVHRHGVTVSHKQKHPQTNQAIYCRRDGEILLPKTCLTRKGALLLFVAPENVPGLNVREQDALRRRLQQIESGDRIGTLQRLGQSVLQYGNPDGRWRDDEASITDEENTVILKFLKGLDNGSSCIDMKSQPGRDVNLCLNDLQSKFKIQKSRVLEQDGATLHDMNFIRSCQDKLTEIMESANEEELTNTKSLPTSSHRVLSAGKLVSRVQSANYLGRPTSSIGTDVDSGYDTINQVSRRTTPLHSQGTTPIPHPPSKTRPQSLKQRRNKSLVTPRNEIENGQFLGKTAPCNLDTTSTSERFLSPDSSSVPPNIPSSLSIPVQSFTQELQADENDEDVDSIYSDYSSLEEDILDLSDDDETLHENESEILSIKNERSRSVTGGFSEQQKEDDIGSHGSILQPLLPAYQGLFGSKGTTFSLDMTSPDQVDLSTITVDDSPTELLPHDLALAKSSPVVSTDLNLSSTSITNNSPSAPPPSRPISPMSSTPENHYACSVYSSRSSISVDNLIQERQACVLSPSRRTSSARSQLSGRPHTAKSCASSHRYSVDVPSIKTFHDKQTSNRAVSAGRRPSTGKNQRKHQKHTSTKQTSDIDSSGITYDTLISKSESYQSPSGSTKPLREFTPKIAFAENQSTSESELPSSEKLSKSAKQNKKLLEKRGSLSKSSIKVDKSERLAAAAAFENSLSAEIKALTVKHDEETRQQQESISALTIPSNILKAENKPCKKEEQDNKLEKEVEEMMAVSSTEVYGEEEGMSLEELELEKRILQERLAAAQDKITSGPSSAVSKKGSKKVAKSDTKRVGTSKKGKKQNDNEDTLEKEREELKIRKQLEKERRLQEAMKLQNQIVEKEEERRIELEFMNKKKMELEEQMADLSAEASEAWRMEEEAHDIFVTNQVEAKQLREDRRKAELERKRNEAQNMRLHQRKVMEAARQKEIDMLESIGSDTTVSLRLREEQRKKLEAEEKEEERRLLEMERIAKLAAEQEEERILEMERQSEEEALSRLRQERYEAEEKRRMLLEEARKLEQEERLKMEEIMKEHQQLEAERLQKEAEEKRKADEERQRIMELLRLEEEARQQMQMQMEKRKEVALRRREQNIESRNHLNSIRTNQNMTRPWVFSYYILWPRETYERLMGSDDTKKRGRSSGTRPKAKSAPAGRKR